MSFLVVRFAGEQNNEIIPDFWYVDGKCWWPPRNQDSAVQSRMIVKQNWMQIPVKVISVHGNIKLVTYIIIRYRLNLVFLIQKKC